MAAIFSLDILWNPVGKGNFWQKNKSPTSVTEKNLHPFDELKKKQLKATKKKKKEEEEKKKNVTPPQLPCPLKFNGVPPNLKRIPCNKILIYFSDGLRVHGSLVLTVHK